jgi:hypothetical protein
VKERNPAMKMREAGMEEMEKFSSHKLNSLKKLNHRGRRARRGKNGLRLKAQECMGISSISNASLKAKTAKGFQKMISALSASSSVIFLSSSAEVTEKERFSSPKN